MTEFLPWNITDVFLVADRRQVAAVGRPLASVANIDVSLKQIQ